MRSGTIHIVLEGDENTSAEEFIAKLRTSNERWWQGSGAGEWVFRGVGNADKWKLTPSAWRPRKENELSTLIDASEETVKQFPQDSPHFGSIPPHAAWVTAETLAILSFAKLAIEIGHDLAPINQAYMRYGLMHSGIQPGTVPYLESHAPHAQHHGIPTRLLDWTFNPLIAAFVALSDEYGDASADSLRVWALNRKRVRGLVPNAMWPVDLGIQFIEQPPAQNAYLKAQQGLFTYLNAEKWFDENGQWPSLEEYLTSDYFEEPDEPYLIGISLPRSEFPSALELLDREGIKHALLAPSLDNVAKTVKKRWGLR